MVRRIIMLLLPVVALLRGAEVLSAQAPQGVLHIKVAIRGGDQAVTPVGRHALLISDNPNTTTPRRVVTGPDGTVVVRLRAGNYTVESDQPLAFGGKGYQWIQTLDVRAGSEVTLELTERNAEIGPLDGATPVPAGGASSPPTSSTSTATADRSADTDTGSRTDPSLVFAPFQSGVLRVWSPRMRASGFLVDTGLILTSQKVVGAAATVEVQVSETVTVEGRVVAADETRDVAFVRVDPQAIVGPHPQAIAALKAIPLPCERPMPALRTDQELVALGLPLEAQQDRLVIGHLTRITTREIEADLRLAPSAAGGPLFTRDGTLLGVTTLAADERSSRRDGRAVPITSACELLAAAKTAIASAPVPPATPLPVAPAKPFPEAALREAFSRRGANLQPYRLSGDDFEVAFITPIMNFASQQPDQRTTSRDTRGAQLDQLRLPQWFDFSNWSEYMADLPPVLAIRVTPKLDESFWKSVARGAARTQGMNLPPMKQFKAVFARMRLLCGETEVLPIHRLRLESRSALDEPVLEGFYIFDPAALNPSCGPVKLQLYSEKEPQKADTRPVDPAVVAQLWQDFAPVREP